MLKEVQSLTQKQPFINFDQVARASKSLLEGQTVLRQLSDNCCLPERSRTMNDSLSLVGSMVLELRAPQTQNSDISGAIEKVSILGGQVGKLYATCCTPVREPLYRAFFEKMYLAHLALNAALGIGH